MKFREVKKVKNGDNLVFTSILLQKALIVVGLIFQVFFISNLSNKFKKIKKNYKKK